LGLRMQPSSSKQNPGLTISKPAATAQLPHKNLLDGVCRP
jgi:hypothetical protein